MRPFLAFLFLVALSVQTPLPGLDFLGTTIDPLTYVPGARVVSLGDESTQGRVGPYSVPSWVYSSPIVESTVVHSPYHYDRFNTVQAGSSKDVFSIMGLFSDSAWNYRQTILSKKTPNVTIDARKVVYNITAELFLAPMSESFTELLTHLATLRMMGDVDQYNVWWKIFLARFPPAVVEGYDLGGIVVQFHERPQFDVRAAYFSSVMALMKGKSFAANLARHRYNTSIVSSGGSYVRGMSDEDWEHSLYRDPAIIGYRLTDTASFISPILFKHIDARLVRLIQREYVEAWDEYIRKNTHYGCTDRKASNFNLGATVDAGCQYNGEPGVIGEPPVYHPFKAPSIVRDFK